MNTEDDTYNKLRRSPAREALDECIKLHRTKSVWHPEVGQFMKKHGWNSFREALAYANNAPYVE